MNARKNIPESIKLKVRQKCNFGCIICRNPIYDYEHFKEYSLCKTHEEDNIFLLCPNCHRNKGRLYSRDEITRRLTTVMEQPAKGGVLNFDWVWFELAGNSFPAFTKLGVSINVLNRLVISIQKKSGSTTINVLIKNEEGKVLLEIIDSEIIRIGNSWDIRHTVGKIVFRNKPRALDWSFSYNADSGMIGILGSLKIDSELTLNFKDSGIYINNHLLVRRSIVNFSIGHAFYVVDSSDISRGLFCGHSAVSNMSLENVGITSQGHGFVYSLAYLKNVALNGIPDRISCASINF